MKIQDMILKMMMCGRLMIMNREIIFGLNLVERTRPRIVIRAAPTVNQSVSGDISTGIAANA
jgi:hypothetical protein